MEVFDMNDLISYLLPYEKIKEIADLIDEAHILRKSYYGRRFSEMYFHIAELTRKYQIETSMWNSVNTKMPADEYEAFRNAEAFLKSVADYKLVKLGVK